MLFRGIRPSYLGCAPLWKGRYFHIRLLCGHAALVSNQALTSVVLPLTLPPQRNYRTFLLFVYTSTVLCLYVFGLCVAMLFVKHDQLVEESDDASGLWGKTLGKVRQLQRVGQRSRAAGGGESDVAGEHVVR